MLCPADAAVWHTHSNMSSCDWTCREEEGRNGNPERGLLLSNGGGDARAQDGSGQLGRQQSLKPGSAMPELTLPQCLVMLAAGSSHGRPLLKSVILVQSCSCIIDFSRPPSH